MKSLGFQFLTGSRFHFYVILAYLRRKINQSFNSLQEVGFISTGGRPHCKPGQRLLFQFLTGSRFHFYTVSNNSSTIDIVEFQFLTGSRFHFYLAGLVNALLPGQMFQFLTGSRFHFYDEAEVALTQVVVPKFQFLTGSRFHFYEALRA